MFQPRSRLGEGTDVGLLLGAPLFLRNPVPCGPSSQLDWWLLPGIPSRKAPGGGVTLAGCG